MSHADSDLIIAKKALKHMLPEFGEVICANLQHFQSEEQFLGLLGDSLLNSDVIVVRLLGKPETIPGFTELIKHCQRNSHDLLVLSGTTDLDPELACMSTVSPDILQEAHAYFQAGGVTNIVQLLKYLSDRLLLTTHSYAPPTVLPEHGIYHPDLPEYATVDDWLRLCHSNKPTVGISFYRAHWLSGNTDFIDSMVHALKELDINALPVYTSSLRIFDDADDSLPAAYKYFWNGKAAKIDVLINTTSFAMAEVNNSGATPAGSSVQVLSRLNVPVIQAITSGMTLEQWLTSPRGLNPLDTAMNVVLPEFDGRIITVPISFKQKCKNSIAEHHKYLPVEDRIKRIAAMASRLIKLRRKHNQDKRTAFIFTNSNSKASQIGNAVGLDAPASLMHVLKSMQERGYTVSQLPDSGDSLIHELIDRCSYDQTYLTGAQCAKAIGRVSKECYSNWFADLSPDLQYKVETQWGAPPGQAYVHDEHLVIAGLEFGNVVVILQPPRGYGMDANAIYHQPDLPPTHHYYAVYRWLKDVWQADAIVHVGKHGTLEWLPGKSIGLSTNCYPDALLDDMPLFYPFILNDPGEGAQAKRRAHAVIVDHLTPPMTTADTYGLIAQLAQLVDEYYQVEMLEPSKLPLIQQQIWDLIKKANLDSDLKLILAHDHDNEEHKHEHEDQHEHEHQHSYHREHAPWQRNPAHSDISKHDQHHEHKHEDHDEEWDETLTPEGIPVTLAKMGGFDVSHLVQEIDGYLCELGAAEIRDGLHTLGQGPKGEQLIEMLRSLTRLPNLDVPGLQAALAEFFGFLIDELLEQKGKRIVQPSELLSQIAESPIITHSDALEAIDSISRALYSNLSYHRFAPQSIDQVISETLVRQSQNIDTAPCLFPETDQSCGSQAPAPCDGTVKIKSTLLFATKELVPNLDKTHEEIDNLLAALEGKYVPAGPSGSPSRGMAHILPTGRNFYSVDPRSLPSQSAWRVGQQLANEVLRRHLKETGKYPESISLSVWGTSAMRTHGDDVAEILALMGVRPVWQPGTRRLSGVELIPLTELGRPRIDVTTRISGFFRDAFPHLIDLIDLGVEAAINADEPEDKNFIRKHYIADLAAQLARGVSHEDANHRSRYRIFGSKPGSYGAGILPLIQERNWQTAHDFAEAYVNWGGYAYTRESHGIDARSEFRQRLSAVQVALHNQDNREHDIFDSDDYLQFHGGMIATIYSLTGRKPRHYFGDSSNPSLAKIRDLKEEALRVFRSRVVNPKWIESIKRHGYKGGLELTATVDYLFGYDATADVLDDWMYEQVAQTYALSTDMQEFFAESNPWALNAIAERLLEAAQRNMWERPSHETLSALKQTYLNSETLLEARGEKPRQTQGVV